MGRRIAATQLLVDDRVHIHQGLAKVIAIRPYHTPEKLVVVFESENGSQMTTTLFRDEEVEMVDEITGKVHIDRRKLIPEIGEKLQERLRKGVETFGTEYYGGKDPLSALDEELLDAIIYLWIARRTPEYKVRPDLKPTTDALKEIQNLALRGYVNKESAFSNVTLSSLRDIESIAKKALKDLGE